MGGHSQRFGQETVGHLPEREVIPINMLTYLERGDSSLFAGVSHRFLTNPQFLSNLRVSDFPQWLGVPVDAFSGFTAGGDAKVYPVFTHSGLTHPELGSQLGVGLMAQGQGFPVDMVVGGGCDIGRNPQGITNITHEALRASHRIRDFLVGLLP